MFLEILFPPSPRSPSGLPVRVAASPAAPFSTSLGTTNRLSAERLPRPRLAERGLSVERWGVEFLHSSAHAGPGHKAAGFARRTRLPVRAEGMHHLLCAEEQIERGRLPERTKGSRAGKRSRGLRAVWAGAEGSWRGEAGL